MATSYEKARPLPVLIHRASAACRGLLLLRHSCCFWRLRLLVFPAEVPALPDIGEAARAVRFRHPLLEGVGVRIVRLIGRRLAEDAAEVDEVLLRRLALGAICAAPFIDELLGRHFGAELAGIQKLWN